MKEKQNQLQQYFFDAETIGHLADLASRFPRPCCLAAPTIGAELERRGVEVRVLDVDRRWNQLSGFLAYDMLRPRRLRESFGIILSDPPFFALTISEFFKAIRSLTDGDDTRPILFCHLLRQSEAIVDRFARYGVEPIAYYPGYRNVQNNGIQLFGNLGTDTHARLAALCSRRLTDTPQKR